MAWLRVCVMVAAGMLVAGGCSFGGGSGDEGAEPTQTRRFQIGDGGGKSAPVEFPSKPAATVKSSISDLEIELYDVHKAGRVGHRRVRAPQHW